MSLSRIIVRLSILSAICLGILHIANAKIWTINNNPGEQRDYYNLQLAHDGVLNGDTLYVHGSNIDYGGLVLSKHITIIGPGYFLVANGTRAKIVSARTGEINFSTGSDGSAIIGMVIGGPLSIDANNILVKRNNITASSIMVGFVNPNTSQVILQQNFIEVISSPIDFIRLKANNVFICNNCIRLSRGSCAILGGPGYVEIVNNILSGCVQISGGRYQNNILLSDTPPDNSINTVSNNITDDGSIFEGGNSPDGQYMLRTGSPAIGAGVNGVDCGMFGGDSPYVLSGIPPIPKIYSFDAPLEGGNQLPVKIKVKSNK